MRAQAATTVTPQLQQITSSCQVKKKKTWRQMSQSRSKSKAKPHCWGAKLQTNGQHTVKSCFSQERASTGRQPQLLLKSTLFGDLTGKASLSVRQPDPMDRNRPPGNFLVLVSYHFVKIADRSRMCHQTATKPNSQVYHRTGPRLLSPTSDRHNIS